MNIAVIDYKMSNMFSIKNALDVLGYNSQITSKSREILKADGAVLPGVGSFPDAMQHLHDLELINVIKEFISSGKPFMGICLGLQLLFSKSEEFHDCEGINIIDGKVESFSKYLSTQRIPHVGWNTVINHNPQNNNSSALNNKIQFCDNQYYYFVHSFFVKPDNKDHVFTKTCYVNFEFCSSVVVNNIFACQFHPEKSGVRGLKILKNFFKK
jgi:glutamine amidotransferase